jgi:SAM-dependent methyltransferase
MNPAAYLEMAETESIHWWYSGRRSILWSIIVNSNLPLKSEVLEVGCGTGGNLEMLANFGTVSAFEMDENALEIACKKTDNHYEIKKGYLPNQIPFTNRQFDLIVMTDVLEHIEQDVEALVSIKKLLKKNGCVILTVPAYQWLYGTHDKFLHHYRRYSARRLIKIIESSGFVSEKLSYFNTILFPLAVMVRIMDKFGRSQTATGTSVPPKFINIILKALFSAERYLLGKFDFPFGVSLLCVLRKTDNYKKN